ncbi:hypothetical protein FCM35_KLT16589 [Carex littledalei]|uniref:Uncharacterized protein n=1 Tax=Carex littledalei TaxID=544730 RepID=A0A833VX39_9POAL|nr:hypothetical protein FCM35_KLT02835 [Carex littledalei]KAF3339118.1 hypothetical protein FCM35_KLT16589 [Carex littledalei]
MDEGYGIYRANLAGTDTDPCGHLNLDKLPFFEVIAGDRHGTAIARNVLRSDRHGTAITGIAGITGSDRHGTDPDRHGTGIRGT